MGREKDMRDNYDFKKMKGVKNPYIRQLKQRITMRLDKPTIIYFKALADELGMPYQSLINLYLRDCAQNKKKPHIEWAKSTTSAK
jgi:predicted DNA binding CopG/RHH family protein